MIHNIESVKDLDNSKDYIEDNFHLIDNENIPNKINKISYYNDFSYFNPEYISSEQISEEFVGSYSSPFVCCFLDASAEYADYKCNPIYKDFSPECNYVIKDYCLQDNHVFNKCKKWCDKYPLLCQQKKLDICNSNNFEKNKLDCMQFCSDNKGECDTKMKNTCENETNLNEAEKEYCSCFIESSKNLYSPAICNSTCYAKGYKTKIMSNDMVCPVQVCNIEISAKSNVADIKDNSLILNCGHPDRTKKTIAINPNLFDNKVDDFRLSNLTIMIPLIFFIVFLILGFLILLYFL